MEMLKGFTVVLLLAASGFMTGCQTLAKLQGEELTPVQVEQKIAKALASKKVESADSLRDRFKPKRGVEHTVHVIRDYSFLSLKSHLTMYCLTDVDKTKVAVKFAYTKEKEKAIDIQYRGKDIKEFKYSTDPVQKGVELGMYNKVKSHCLAIQEPVNDLLDKRKAERLAASKRSAIKAANRKKAKETEQKNFMLKVSPIKERLYTQAVKDMKAEKFSKRNISPARYGYSIYNAAKYSLCSVWAKDYGLGVYKPSFNSFAIELQKLTEWQDKKLSAELNTAEHLTLNKVKQDLLKGSHGTDLVRACKALGENLVVRYL